MRDDGGFRTEDLELANPQLQFRSDGVYSSARTDIGFEAALSDLALLDPRASAEVGTDILGIGHFHPRRPFAPGRTCASARRARFTAICRP